MLTKTIVDNKKIMEKKKTEKIMSKKNATLTTSFSNEPNNSFSIRIGFHVPNGNRLPGISENIQLNVVPITWMFLQIPEHTLTFRDLFPLELETNLCE